MERYRITAPQPSFGCQACLPLADRQTMEVHIHVLVGRLCADLNVLIDGFPMMHGMEAEEICRRAFQLPRLIREDVRFSAGGIACHDYYFRYLRADEGEHLPGDEVAEVLRRSFGSADSFFYIFREEAKRMQTGGFLWLCTESRSHVSRLRLITTRGYDLPPAPYLPLLALDLWEHAYIGRFGEDRRAYADTYLRRLDWDAVGNTIAARACGG